MQLHQLIYVSTATEPLDDDALGALLARYRPRNQGSDITGLLLYSEGLFLQLLEGPRAAVHELYHKHIARDPRHEALHLLADGPAAARAFPDWYMAFQHASAGDAAALAGYLNPAAPDFLAPPVPLAAPVLLRLLHRFMGRPMARSRR